MHRQTYVFNTVTCRLSVLGLLFLCLKFPHPGTGTTVALPHEYCVWYPHNPHPAR